MAPTAAPTSGPVPSPTITTTLTPAPTLAPVPSPYATLTPPPTAPAASTGDGSDAAVRRVIFDYKRAIESQDIALFRSLKPDLSQAEEKSLRESFKAIKAQVVGISVESVQLDGDRATVRVARQDMINGRPMRAMNQTFHLARSGSAWQIRSIGQ
jgi:hypothetical protein